MIGSYTKAQKELDKGVFYIFFKLIRLDSKYC